MKIILLHLFVLILFSSCSAFLLPPKVKLGELKVSNKFEKGLVACGKLFCAPENCIEYCDEHGITIHECAE